MRTKYFLFFLACLLTVNTICKAQEKKALNSIYFEAGGNALYYSINYDRSFNLTKNIKLTPRAGLSFLPDIDKRDRLQNFIIPIELNLLYGKNELSKNFAELGLGITFFESEKGYKTINNIDHAVIGFLNVGLLRAGFRHQKPGGGLMYRAGLIVPISQDEYSKQYIGDEIFFRIWAGFGIGYTF